MNNPFLTKKDPLVEAVQSAMQDGEIRRQAEALVNEEFGVYSRKAVVREQLAAYDARLEEAYKCMKEGEKLAKKDYDKDGKIESPKDEVWGSRFRAAKMAGKMEEEQIDEISTEKLIRYRNKAGEGREKGAKLAYAKLTGKAKVPATMPKHSYMEEDKDPCWKGYEMVGMKKKGGRKVPNCVPVKEEEQIDEVSAGLAQRAAHHAFVKSDKMKKDAQKEPDMHSYVQAVHKGEKKSKQGTKFAKYAAKKMDEEQIDEISKELTRRYKDKAHASYNYSAGKRSDDEFVSGPGKGMRDVFGKLKFKERSKEAQKADDKTIQKRLKGLSMAHKKLAKEETDYSAPDRAAVTRDNKPSTPAQTNAATSGPSAADKAALASKISTMKEAAYSAKAARAGKDIGKPGKMFKKIAKKAGERYGSEERGKKVAGAILKRIRAKHMKEENLEELSQFGSAFAAARKSGQTQFSFGGKSYTTAMKGQSSTPAPKPATSSVPTPTPRPTMASDLPTIDKGPAPGPASTPQSAIAAAAAKKTASPMPPSRPANLGKPEPGAEASKFVRSQMNESVQVGENKYRIV